ncbi:hypothetical protein G9A89_023168 [Geosiphon pyriformis]|nr:hypothetical protein G9A89_023168 [Geosiphon pyriformis]
MILGHLRTRGVPAFTRRPLLSIAQRSSYLSRCYTTPAQNEKKLEPKEKARSIIDSLPGNSIISKTGYITLGAGLATIAISKELYVFNEETYIVVSFIGLCTILYKLLRQPLNDAVEAHSQRIYGTLNKAREDHKLAVQNRIEQVAQLGDIVDVTKGLFAISKETARLEAEAFELKQKAELAAEVKSVLDAWVRYEASIREREQRALANTVIEKIKRNLQDTKFQQQILNESIAEIESLVR